LFHWWNLRELALVDAACVGCVDSAPLVFGWLGLWALRFQIKFGMTRGWGLGMARGEAPGVVLAVLGDVRSWVWLGEVPGVVQGDAPRVVWGGALGVALGGALRVVLGEALPVARGARSEDDGFLSLGVGVVKSLKLKNFNFSKVLLLTWGEEFSIF
jgi:hypothetical protein